MFTSLDDISTDYQVILRTFTRQTCWLLQYVVIPTRRSTAEAVQILISHALGDAGSPYLIGVVSVLLSTTRYMIDIVLLILV